MAPWAPLLTCRGSQSPAPSAEPTSSSPWTTKPSTGDCSRTGSCRGGRCQNHKSSVLKHWTGPPLPRVRQQPNGHTPQRLRRGQNSAPFPGGDCLPDTTGHGGGVQNDSAPVADCSCRSSRCVLCSLRCAVAPTFGIWAICVVFLSKRNGKSWIACPILFIL